MNVRLDNISKKFADKVIFNGFTHLFEDEKITVITGESGCGKTTLLRIIAGLDKDYKGNIIPSKYTVSFAFQEHRLFPGATVMENMEVAGDKKLSAVILRELGINEEDFTSFPHELSGGMARRVSLARAIVKQADIYLFDEPFTGLDEENAKTAAKVIKKYCKNKTCIVVTHDKDLAKTFGDIFLEL